MGSPSLSSSATVARDWRSDWMWMGKRSCSLRDGICPLVYGEFLGSEGGRTRGGRDRAAWWRLLGRGELRSWSTCWVYGRVSIEVSRRDGYGRVFGVVSGLGNSLCEG